MGRGLGSSKLLDPASQKENITWAGTLDTLLAFKMRDEYHKIGSLVENYVVRRD